MNLFYIPLTGVASWDSYSTEGEDTQTERYLQNPSPAFERELQRSDSGLEKVTLKELVFDLLTLNEEESEGLFIHLGQEDFFSFMNEVIIPRKAVLIAKIKLLCQKLKIENKKEFLAFLKRFSKLIKEQGKDHSSYDRRNVRFQIRASFANMNQVYFRANIVQSLLDHTRIPLDVVLLIVEYIPDEENLTFADIGLVGTGFSQSQSLTSSLSSQTQSQIEDIDDSDHSSDSEEDHPKAKKRKVKSSKKNKSEENRPKAKKVKSSYQPLSLSLSFSPSSSSSSSSSSSRIDNVFKGESGDF